MHFLFGSAVWPPSQLLNTSPEGKNEKRPVLYFSCFLLWGLFFFLVMNLYIHVFLQGTAQLLSASQYWYHAFIHLIVSGATGVPWKRGAGFPC